MICAPGLPAPPEEKVPSASSVSPRPMLTGESTGGPGLRVPAIVTVLAAPAAPQADSTSGKSAQPVIAPASGPGPGSHASTGGGPASGAAPPSVTLPPSAA